MKEIRVSTESNTKRGFGNNIFDILRLWAILQVTVGHLGQHLQVQLPTYVDILFRFPGVVVLFAISGFLVTASFDRLGSDTGGRKEYVKRRFCRIFPGLWVSIIVSSVCIFWCYNIKPNFSQGLVYVVTQFSGCNFYTGGWLRGYGVGAPNGSLWTICIELQFYAFIMFVWKWLKDQKISIWLIWISCGSIINVISEKWGGMSESILHKLFTVTLFPYLYMFLLGAMAYRYLQSFIELVRKYRLALLIGLVGLTYLGNQYVVAGEYVNILSGISLACLTCVMAYVPGYCIRLPIDISYGIYLYHMIIVNVLVELGMTGRMEYFIAALVGSVACGVISWYGVEKRWLKRKKGKQRIIETN